MKSMNSKSLGCILYLLSAVLLSNIVAVENLPIDFALAYQYFQEADALCKQDNGKLWVVSLSGPMLFVDRETRQVAANQIDKSGYLTKQENVFVGKLPDEMPIANTAIDWAGVKWTMVVWPLPGDKFERAWLMAHESWHRIQSEIGLPPSMPSNNHLDLLEGRIWLQLEWRALREALIHHGAQRLEAIKNALTFRLYRRTLFPQASSEERELEMHEGLAEYTGIRLSGIPSVNQYLAGKLRDAEKNETFVRTFAYVSGPAYGILLDEAKVNWRDGLRPSNDLGVLLQELLSVELPLNVEQAAKKASTKYGEDALRALETKRENNRQKTSAAYRTRLVDGPVLVIPLDDKWEMEFSPSNLHPLDSFGTVYPNIRVVGVWGILTVSNGALMSPDSTKITVSAPNDPNTRPIQGDGWSLEPTGEWALAHGERKGDYILKKN
jgi:hypothetical protein